MLRGSADFMRYAVGVTVHKIQQLEETGHTDGPDGHHADKAFHHLCDITRSHSHLQTYTHTHTHTHSDTHTLTQRLWCADAGSTWDDR